MDLPNSKAHNATAAQKPMTTARASQRKGQGKALRMATAKERAAVEGWLGFAVPAGEGPVPKQLALWYNTDLPEIGFDVEAARAALEAAGYGWDAQGRLHYPKK